MANTFIVRKQFGVIVPLSAMMLVLMLGLVGLAFYILGYGASAEMSRNSAKFTVLGAMESYMDTKCAVDASVSTCHTQKMEAALLRANEIADRNSGGLATVVASNQNQPGGVSDLSSMLEPLRWYDKKPDNSDPCSGEYPCAQPLDSQQLANAMRISGRASDKLSSMLSFGMFGNQLSRAVAFSTTAVASPMHAMFVMDLSSSIAEDTHLGVEDAANKNAGNGWAKAGRSIPYFASFYSYLAKSQSIAPTTFGQFIPDDEGNQTVQQVWSSTPTQRPNNSTAVTDHFQTDYQLTFSYAETTAGRSSYFYKSKHPTPGTDSIVEQDYGPREALGVGDTTTLPDDEIPLLMDRYRSATLKGPEPMMSIASGIQTFLQRMRERQVSGDKAGVIFASDKLTWNKVINLTDDLDYINSVLDFSHGGGIASPQNPAGPIDPESIRDEPLWIQLNLFPWANRNTDLYGALRMASIQLAVDGDLSLLNNQVVRPAIPSVDFVVVFTDGLGNCAPNSEGGGISTCANNYIGDDSGHGGYKASKLAIDQLAYENYFQRKIPLHVVLAGNQSGPHMIKTAKNSGDSGGGKNVNIGFACSTEEEMRTAGKPLAVDDASCTTDSECQDKWNNRFTAPFTVAVRDWYGIATKTGGVYAPILKTGAGCKIQNVDKNCKLGRTVKYTSDPACRSAADQVQSYLDQILRGSNAFTIVTTQ